MVVSDDMHVITVDIYRSHLSDDIVDFVGFFCGFFVDLITSYCLRINIKLFHGIRKLSFIDKLWNIHVMFHGAKWVSSIMQVTSLCRSHTTVNKLIFNSHLIHIVDLLTYSMEQSPSWEANRFAASHFLEPEGSLPHSQVPATCPYPEPARSSPYPHIPLPEDPS